MVLDIVLLISVFYATSLTYLSVALLNKWLYSADLVYVKNGSLKKLTTQLHPLDPITSGTVLLADVNLTVNYTW